MLDLTPTILITTWTVNCPTTPIEKHNLLDGRSGGLGNKVQPDVAEKKPILNIKI